MHVTLQFDLPEERSEHLLAVNGPEYFNCLWDLNVEVRRRLKYDENTKDVEQLLTYITDFINETVNLDEIE